MYLVGTFSRDYFDHNNNKPMSLVFLRETVTKDDLVRASQDDDYQVIDLIQRKYYDPKQNKWLPIEKS